MTSETTCVGKADGRAVTEGKKWQEIFGTWEHFRNSERPLKVPWWRTQNAVSEWEPGEKEYQMLRVRHKMR